MKGKVLLPPHYETLEGPLIFLGGPIKGASYWHNEAIQIIQRNADEINVASPSRGVDKKYLDANPTPFKHSANQEEWEQVDWECYDSLYVFNPFRLKLFIQLLLLKKLLIFLLKNIS